MKKSSGLIPNEFIERLLLSTELTDIISKHVSLKKSGKNYQACCPFHDEKSPSFTVSPEKQFYYCFGCGENGNAINFIMKQQGVPFTEAVAILAKASGLKIPESPQSPAAQQKKAQSKHLISVMEFAETFFSTQLFTKPANQEVVNYLRKRNLTKGTIEAFKLGYAPSSWDSLIKAFKKANISLKAAIEAGLVIQKGANKQYDRFRDRLIFPIHSRRGDVIAFGGRALNNTDTPKYLNSPETLLFQKSRELYGLYQITQASSSLKRIIVVEGYFDVLMLWQNQIQYAVATLGTSTSSGHLETLFRFVDEVIFCFDGDKAGAKAGFRALEASIPLMRDGREVRFLFLPSEEDPDSLVQKEGREQFELRIKEAKSLPDLLCETIMGDLDLGQLEHRSRFARDIAPQLAKFPMGIYRELVINKVAELTHLDRNLLLSRIEHNGPPSSEPSFNTRPEIAGSHASTTMALSTSEQKQKSLSKNTYNHIYSDKSNSPAPSLVNKTIALLLHKPSLAKEVEPPETLRNLKLENITLLLEVIDAAQKEPIGSSAYLFGRWHGSALGDQLAKIAAQELFIQQDIDTESYQKSYKDSLIKLNLAYIEQQLEEVLNSPEPDPRLIQKLLKQKASVVEPIDA